MNSVNTWTTFFLIIVIINKQFCKKNHNQCLPWKWKKNLMAFEINLIYYYFRDDFSFFVCKTKIGMLWTEREWLTECSAPSFEKGSSKAKNLSAPFRGLCGGVVATSHTVRLWNFSPIPKWVLTFHSNTIPAYNMHIFRETNFRLKKR